MSTPSLGKPLPDLLDQPASPGVPVTVADLELAFRGIQDGDQITAVQHALLDKFFRQGVPQRDSCIAEFVGSSRSVHVPSPSWPDDIASLSPLCADAAGRVYRYDREAKELVLLIAPKVPS